MITGGLPVSRVGLYDVEAIQIMVNPNSVLMLSSHDTEIYLSYYEHAVVAGYNMAKITSDN